MGTETDQNRLHLIPKRTSMGTRNGRVGYDRKDPNKVMYSNWCVNLSLHVDKDFDFLTFSLYFVSNDSFSEFTN